MKRFLAFRGDKKYKPNRTTQQITEETNTSEKPVSIQYLAIRAKLYLKVKDRTGKNTLLENYLNRIKGMVS